MCKLFAPNWGDRKHILAYLVWLLQVHSPEVFSVGRMNQHRCIPQYITDSWCSLYCGKWCKFARVNKKPIAYNCLLFEAIWRFVSLQPTHTGQISIIPTVKIAEGFVRMANSIPEVARCLLMGLPPACRWWILTFHGTEFKGCYLWCVIPLYNSTFKLPPWTEQL